MSYDKGSLKYKFFKWLVIGILVFGGCAIAALQLNGVPPAGSEPTTAPRATAELATETATMEPTATHTATPTPTPTPSPSATRTPTPKPSRTPRPTAAPLPTRTAAPAATPTSAPLATPPPPPAATATGAIFPGCTCQADTLNCGDFDTHSEAQSCFNFCVQQGAGDIYGLDQDNDGNACESLP
jgi:hypothetical protein